MAGSTYALLSPQAPWPLPGERPWGRAPLWGTALGTPPPTVSGGRTERGRDG